MPSTPHLCAQTLEVWWMVLAANSVLGALEAGNFWGGAAFSQCTLRPDVFWRIIVVCKVLLVTGAGMVAIYRGMSRSFPGELITNINDLAGKALLAFEIIALGSFSIVLSASYSTCEIRGFWVGTYYWLLATLAFLLSCLLGLMWYTAGPHVFRRYDQDLTRKLDLNPYILSIKNAETEQDQRNQYRQYRIAVESHYNSKAFSAFDIPFIERYATCWIGSTGLLASLSDSQFRCVECDEPFSIGDGILFLKNCSHLSHYSCLARRILWSDLCFCGSEIRQSINQANFEAAKSSTVAESVRRWISAGIIQRSSAMITTTL